MAGAIAAAITTAIPSLAAYSTAVTAVASVSLYAGTAYAQYLITQAQQPKPKVGTKLRFSFGGDVPQSIGVGEYETAGSLVYAWSWGPNNGRDNAYLVQVFCTSDMPSSELLERIWINGEKDLIDFAAGQRIENGNTMGYPVVGKRKNSDDKMWIKFKDGSQTVADPYLRDKFGSVDKPWTADMIGRGRTLIIVTTKYDKKEPDGVPQCRFVLRGIKLYNPKKDSTNGGSGAHRWNDQSTYEWDDNPGVVQYNIARGIYYGSEWMYGGRNWSSYMLDNNSFFASINASNDDVPLKGGGTQKRWQVGGEISLDSAIFDTLDEINAACNGRMATSGGRLYFDCGSYGAEEFVFTDGELFPTDQIESAIQPSPRDVFNTVIATYTEPGIGGELKACNPRSKAEFVTADGGIIRRATPTLRFCRNNVRAQRIAQKMLLDNRRTVTRQVIMGPERRDGMRANLVGGWNSDRYQYSDKEWIFGDTLKYPNGVMLVELRELNPSDDTWTPVTDEDDFTVGTWGRVLPSVEIMPITVEQWPIKNSGGIFKSPGLRIEWDLDDPLGDNKRVWWQLRLLDSSEIMADGTADFDQGFAVIAQGLVKNEAYQVRAKLIPISDYRETDFTDWDDTDVYPGALDYILAPDADSGGTVDDDPPPNIVTTPTLTLRTEIPRSGDVTQRIEVGLDISARNPTETYRIRVLDTTPSPDQVRNFFTGEFPKDFVVAAGHSYEVRIAPVSRFGVIGTYTSVLSMTVAKKGSGSVPDVAGLDATAGHRRVTIEWDPVDMDTYPDWGVTQIQRATNSGFTTGVKLYERKGTSFIDGAVGNKAQRYYRVRHVDTSGNPGNWSSTLDRTSILLDTADITEGAVLGSDSISLRSKAWTVSTNGKDTKDIIKGDAKVDNSSGSPLLLSWQLKASIIFKAGIGTKGAAFGSIQLILTHVQSGERYNIGKFDAKTSDKKKSGTHTFKGSYLFAQTKKEDASFTLKAISTRRVTGTLYDKLKFNVEGPPIEIRKWKV